MSERLIYLPLGGAGEIGMNAYVYGYGQPGRERLRLDRRCNEGGE